MRLTPPSASDRPAREGEDPEHLALDARITLWLKCVGLVVLLWLVVERAGEMLGRLGLALTVAVGGVFLAYVFFPLVRRLNERLPLWAAVSIVYAGFAALAAAALAYVVPIVGADFQSLLAALPKLEAQAGTVVNNPDNPFIAHLPAHVRGVLAEMPRQIGTYLQRDAAGWAGNFFGVLASLLALGAIFIAIPVVSIYMLVEAEGMKRTFLGMLPAQNRERAKTVLSELDEVVGGFVRGQCLIALTVAVMVTVMLAIFRVPYALLIGVWAGIADLVPYLGAVAGAVPALAIALLNSGIGEMAALAIGFSVINQVEGNLLAPRIVGRSVRVSPLAVIFGLLIGAELFGVLGMLLAVPIAGALRVAIDNFRPPEPLTNAEAEPALTKAPQAEVHPLSLTSDVTVADVEEALGEVAPARAADGE